MSTTEDSKVVAPVSTPPGWYPDPWGQHGRRYWDGHDWTGRTEDTPTKERPKGRGRALQVAVLGMSAASVIVAAVSFSDRREKLALLAVVLIVPLAVANLAQLARIGRARPVPIFASVAAWLLVVAIVAVGGYRGFQQPSSCADDLGANAKLVGCNLAGRDLTAFDLHGADLSNADLGGADLSAVNLSDANLSNAILRHANLTSARLERADLRAAVLDGTTLDSAALDGAKLAGTNLQNVHAVDATMVGVDLSGATITGSTLKWAVLTGANLQKSVIDDTTLEESMLDNTKLAGATVSHSKLDGSWLKGADATGATVQDTSMTSAAFAGADFTNATLARVTFDGAQLEEVKGLSDQALAGAFAVDPLDVAKTLSDRGLHLESPASITAAATAVCAGTPAPNAGTTPANGSFVAVVNEGSSSFDWPTAPPALRFLELVVCVGDMTSVDVGECGPYYYSDGSLAHPITRYRESRTVRALSPATAGVVNQQTFDAPEPDACPLVESASTYRMGGDLDDSTVDAGIAQMVTAAGV